MKRLEYINVLSVISCIAVVFLHVNGCFWNFSYQRYWITANIIESVCYFAVPVFFMITGTTLINYRKRYSTKTFMKKRIEKVLIPFVVWSLIAAAYYFYKNPNMLQTTTITMLISNILSNKYISVYWFFIPLFSVYLSIPVFSLIPEENRKEVFLYLVIVTFLFNSLFPFVTALSNITYNTNFKIAVGGGYIFYIIIGYYISHYEISKKTRMYIYIAGIIGLVAHILGTMYLSYEAGKIISTFKGYTNVPCILYSIAIFVYFRYFDFNKIKPSILKIVHIINEHTFSIYLTHYFVIDIFRRIFEPNINSIIYRLLFPVAVLLICISISKCIRYIPGLKKIIP